MNPFVNCRSLNYFIVVLLGISLFSHSILLCRAAAACLIFMCYLMGRNERFIVNPMFLFAITPLSLLIYMNLGDVYMVDLEYETWFIALMNMYVFVMAYKHTPSFTNKSYCIGNSSITSLQTQAIFFYLISLTGMFIPAIASVVWIFSIVSIVCALKTRKKWMLLFVIAIFLVSAFGFTSKTTMLTYCITFIICIEKYYTNNENQKKYVRLALGLGIIFMIFSFTFANKDRGAYDSNEGVEVYTSKGLEWNYDAGLFMPYMYITNGWTNLQFIMETQDTRTNGLWMAKPLLGYLQVSDKYESEYQIYPYSSFNTCAYMTYGFKDFGYWFSVIMSVFLGFFVKRIYSRYILSRSPYDSAAYVLVAQATLEMFFSNHFFTQSYPFTVVILMALVKWFMKRRKEPVELECK